MLPIYKDQQRGYYACPFCLETVCDTFCDEPNVGAGEQPRKPEVSAPLMVTGESDPAPRSVISRLLGRDW